MRGSATAPTMGSFDVRVQVLEDFDGLLSEGWLTDVAERALAVGLADSEASLGLVIAGDEVVRELNRTHRGLDESTDVLAFSFAHQGEYYGEVGRANEPEKDVTFVLPPEESVSLGEVIISYPQARRQAVTAGHPLEKELAVLVAHGVLHLLGYDHLDPGEEAAMENLESEVIGQVWR